MKKVVFLAALVAFASPAFATHCPTLVKKIDDVVKTAQLDDATKQKVMDLYNKGKAEHEAGDHDASAKDLDEALKLLGQ